MKKLVAIISIFLVSSVLSAQVIPIHEIQSNRDTTGASTYQGQVVTTTGIVTAVGLTHPRVFFLEEEGGGPWSGIMAFFRYDTSVVTVNPGDSVVITGDVYEYFGNTEIRIFSTADIQIVATGRPIPGPDTIPASKLDDNAASDDTLEAYEGVLVTIENAFVTDSMDNRGRFTITDGTGYAKARQGNSHYNPVVGDMITITGCVNVYYGAHVINPRSDDDVIPLNPHLSMAYATSPTTVDVIFTKPMDAASVSDPTKYDIPGLTVNSATADPENLRLVHLGTSEQTSAEGYWLYVSDVQDTSGAALQGTDSTKFYGAFVPIHVIQSEMDTSGQSIHAGNVYTVTGIVTADSSAFPWYYIEEPEGGPWSGIQVYDRVNEPTLGDSIVVVAEVAEYNLMTELKNIVYFEIASSGNPVPDPITLTTGVLSDTTGEPYEGVLVHVDSATVVGIQTNYFEIDDGSGICRVGNMGAYTYQPDTGDVINVTGVVSYRGAYEIEPRGDEDITVVQSIEEGSTVPGPRPHLIGVNTLTNGNINIALSLPHAASVDVSLYDVAGRMLSRNNIALEAGNRSISLNAPLKSGVYFLKINADGRSFVRKITVVR